jgi:pyruvate,water dikinase
VITGFDVADLRSVEMPEVLVRALMNHIKNLEEPGPNEGDTLAVQLRDEVPSEHRETFDQLLVEARFVYGIRDERSDGVDDWAVGLLRRALLEIGRRLQERGTLKAADHAVDLSHDEVLSLLCGKVGPSKEEVAQRVSIRLHSQPEDAPDFVGFPPTPPPPPDCLPAPTARAVIALGAYLAGMFMEHESKAEPTGEQKVIHGLAASSGKCVGRARIVVRPEEFSKVQKGDVLVARVTAPSYNVLLPMLAGIVTDRGGLLSHPAIVSREYGIPGVVGSKHATTTIPDGATVEVDGDAGTVRVLN